MIVFLTFLDWLGEVIALIPFLWSLMWDYWLFLYQDRQYERKLNAEFRKSAT